MFLQSLIRGRAAQNEMYEGKERRRDHIQELRATHALSKAQQEIKEKQRQQALELRERQVGNIPFLSYLKMPLQTCLFQKKKKERGGGELSLLQLLVLLCSLSCSNVTKTKFPS